MPIVHLEGRASFHVRRSEKMKVKRSQSSSSTCVTPKPDMVTSEVLSEDATPGALMMSPPRLVQQLSVPDSNAIRAMLAKYGYIPEDKPLIPGMFVRAATMEKLVELTIEQFCRDGKPCPQTEEYVRVLFLMHQWFIESEQLAQIFLRRYRQSDQDVPCTESSCHHKLTNDDCCRTVYKCRICHTVRYWIRHFPMCFDLNPQLAQAVHSLQGMIRQDSIKEECVDSMADLVDTSKVPSYDWIRNMSVRNPTPRHTSRKVSLVFNNLQPTELADQLTYMEYKAFRRVTFSDFKNYAQRASLKENMRLERSIALFNGLSLWIQCMVLSKTTPQQRADVIVKFVNVAKRLLELQNFNTLMSVVGGLTHSSLARLGKTNHCIPSDTQKDFTELTELLSSSNNFSNYRKALNQATGFRIPILGVHLKDLILLNTALPDLLDSNLINFRKMVQMSIIFSELVQVQASTLPVEPNMDLVNTIRLCLDLHYTEDEIYELSLAREPRNSLSPSTPIKPVQFADWAAGVSPPDQDTINKHVHDMVEAVFKNYDHDKDGFISHAEFEAIAGNFPFIASFTVLDADQDGMISKAEMKTYFVRANCHAMRKCFKHNFHETTYFKPTFCIHCTGLLWGLIKQGWKCKDCSIHAHKHCKDLVVMECRSKVHGTGLGRSATFNGGNRDVTLASKRKMSQRQKRSRATKGTQTEDISKLSSANTVFIKHSPIKLKNLSLEGSREESEMLTRSSNNNDGESRQSDIQLEVCQQLLRANVIDDFETQDKLLAENEALRTQLNVQGEQIDTLKAHIGVIRQHTITFILDQMDTLHMQRDTEV